MTAVYDAHDHRHALREQMKVLKTRGRPLTWRKIAAKIPMQYTFLSKCLNDPATHLSEDHLFRVCELLEFLPDETEFVMLLRARAVTRQMTRQEFLSREIERRRKQKVVRAEHHSDPAGAVNDEMGYLLDPLASLVKASLGLLEMQRNPMRLTSLLGLSERRLKLILEKIERMGFIELSEDGKRVLSYNSRPQHWSRQHPLMRAHLMGLKLQLLDRLRGTDEDHKESFFATFTMDDEGFKEAQHLLQETLKKIQQISQKGRHEGVYQISLDLLKIF